MSRVTDTTATFDWVIDTHALVQFLEDVTAIVPISWLKEQENMEQGGSCIVTWSNKKQYKALLICSGSYELCAQWQDELNGPHDEPTQVMKRPRKTQSKSDEPCKKKISTYENEKEENCSNANDKQITALKEKSSITKEASDTVNSEDGYSSEGESEFDDDDRPAHTIVVDDGSHDRSTSPVHCIHSEQQQFTIREAAKASGIWDKAPYLEDIPVQVLGKFYQTIFNICPKLRPARKMLRKRLSDALMNRRAHLRSLGIISPKKKRGAFLHRQISKEKSDIGGSTTYQKSLIDHGARVDIMSGEALLGTGLVILPSDSSNLFAEVVLKSKNKDIDKEISLYEPVGKKLHFKVADTFKWKTTNLIYRDTKQSVADLIQNQELQSDDDNDVDNDEDSYERKRMINIMYNKRVLKEVMEEETDDYSTKKPYNLMDINDSGQDMDDSEEEMDDSEEEMDDSGIGKSLKGTDDSNRLLAKTKETDSSNDKPHFSSKTKPKPIEKKGSKFWDYIDSDDEEFEKDCFRPLLLTNKRCRKTTYKLK